MEVQQPSGVPSPLIVAPQESQPELCGAASPFATASSASASTPSSQNSMGGPPTPCYTPASLISGGPANGGGYAAATPFAEKVAAARDVGTSPPQLEADSGAPADGGMLAALEAGAGMPENALLQLVNFINTQARRARSLARERGRTGGEVGRRAGGAGAHAPRRRRPSGTTHISDDQ